MSSNVSALILTSFLCIQNQWIPVTLQSSDHRRSRDQAAGAKLPGSKRQPIWIHTLPAGIGAFPPTTVLYIYLLGLQPLIHKGRYQRTVVLLRFYTATWTFQLRNIDLPFHPSRPAKVGIKTAQSWTIQV